jgi:hypothetical protein
MDKANFNIIGPSSWQKGDSQRSTSHGTNQEDPLKRQSNIHLSIRGKGGDPHKGFFSFSPYLDEGEDGWKGQPTLQPIPPG